MSDSRKEDTDEHRTDERRRKRRRRDDEDQLETEQFRGYAFWARLMMVHHGKFIALGPILGLVIGYTIGVTRFNSRVSSLESQVQTLSADVTRLKDTGALNQYMLCTLMKTVAPQGTPPECGPPSTPTPLPRRSQ